MTCMELVEAELQRMKEKSILTEAEAAAVYEKGAAACLESDLG